MELSKSDGTRIELDDNLTLRQVASMGFKIEVNDELPNFEVIFWPTECNRYLDGQMENKWSILNRSL